MNKMKQKRAKRSVKNIALGLLFLLMLTFIPLVAEAMTCEEAFWSCVNDPMNGTYMGGALYCINGYVFCKKYIEKDTAK